MTTVNGQHDAFALAYFRYLHDALHLAPQTSKLAGQWNFSESAGWALPHENICWTCERPAALSLDEQGRLHSLTGPACVYPDGGSIYSIQGVCVPGYVVTTPSGITAEQKQRSRTKTCSAY